MDIFGLENVDGIVNAAGAQQGEHHIHQLVAFLVGHFRKPGFDGGVQEMGAFGDFLRGEKLAAHQFPGVGIMLQQSHGFAADDRIGFFMFQQHADDGGLGNVGFDPGNHGKISGVAHQIFRKTRAVVVVYLQNPLLYHRGRTGCGKYCQIAALGMAAQAHGSYIFLGYCQGISDRQPLGGNGLLEGHVEILFPAYQGAVGAPECQEHTSVIQQKGKGRKLRLLLGNQLILIHTQTGGTEPDRVGCQTQQRQIVFHPHQGLAVVSGKKVLSRFLQGNGDCGLGFHSAAVADVNQRRENQCVHRIRRVLGKRQVTAPAYVIKYICHEGHLPTKPV